jgi:DegV family protein with EDD domain
MKDFVITCDSGTGFTRQELNGLGIKAAYLTYTLGGEEKRDEFDSDEDMRSYYDALKTTPAKTSQAPPEEFIRIWTPALEAGKGVLNIAMSAALSGTYESSVAAKARLEAQYPGMILTLDSVNATFAQQEVIREAVALQKSGKTLQQTYDIVASGLENYQIIFTVADFNHLKRGGRVSNVQALIGTVLNFKPVLAADTAGRISLVEIHRSMNKSLAGVIKRVHTYQTSETTEAFIAHGGDEEAALRLRDMLMDQVPAIRSVKTGPLPPVLGAHGGPGCLVLCFKGKPRLKHHVIG